MDESGNDKPAPETPEQKRNVWLLVAKYGHIGFILPACVFVGLLVGSALDKWLGTKWIIIVGIILGSGAGFLELIRVMIKASKDSLPKPKPMPAFLGTKASFCSPWMPPWRSFI